MKIAVLISSLSKGGAERVVSILCNEWATEGHDVFLLTYQQPDQPVQYPLDHRVTHRPLQLLRESRALATRMVTNLWRIGRVRHCLQAIAPDVLVCFMTECNIIGTMAAKSLGVPVVISERNHPAHRPLRRLDRLARRVVYPMANRLTVQTADIAAWYQGQLRLSPVIIPNPVILPKTQTPAKQGKGRKKIISVGRLVDQKGFDVLIDAFARVAPCHPEAHLTIYGEGPNRKSLEARVAHYALAGRVKLAGVVDDIQTCLDNSDVYVHAARYEGFPNAVVEALAAGLCVVATDAPGATGELLQNGRYGLLARPDDAVDLAAKINLALADEALRKSFAERGAEAVSHLDAPGIAQRWCILFESLGTSAAAIPL